MSTFVLSFALFGGPLLDFFLNSSFNAHATAKQEARMSLCGPPGCNGPL